MRELRERAPRDAHGFVDELALGPAPLRSPTIIDPENGRYLAAASIATSRNGLSRRLAGVLPSRLTRSSSSAAIAGIALAAHRRRGDRVLPRHGRGGRPGAGARGARCNGTHAAPAGAPSSETLNVETLFARDDFRVGAVFA